MFRLIAFQLYIILSTMTCISQVAAFWSFGTNSCGKFRIVPGVHNKREIPYDD